MPAQRPLWGCSRMTDDNQQRLQPAASTTSGMRPRGTFEKLLLRQPRLEHVQAGLMFFASAPNERASHDLTTVCSALVPGTVSTACIDVNVRV